MPNNGQLLEAWKHPADYGWPEMALRCESTATVTLTGSGVTAYGHSAEASTHSVPDIFQVLEGMRLTVSSSFDGVNGSWAVAYYGPGAPSGGFHDSGAVYRSNVSIEVRPQNVLLYSKLTGSLWRIVWDALDVYVNGAYHSTLGGHDAVSNGVGPNYIPIIGMPLRITGATTGSHSSIPIKGACADTDTEDGDAGGVEGGLDDGGDYTSKGRDPVPADPDDPPGDYDPAWTYDPCDPGNGLPITYQTRIETVVAGGWRWYVDGQWEDLPVHVDVRNAPSLGGCSNIDLGTLVTTARTWGNHLALLTDHYYRLEYVDRESPLRSFVDVTCDDLGTTTRTWGPGDVECVDDGCGETHLYRDHYQVTNRSDVRPGSIRLQANLDHLLQRLDSDYAAELFRARFPETRGTASRSCTSRTGSGICLGRNSTRNDVLYPELSEFVGVVGNEDHPLLDCLDYPFTAPVSVSASRQEVIRHDYLSPPRTCICPWSWYGSIPPDICGEGYEGTITVSCGLEWPATTPGSWTDEQASWVFPSYVGPCGGNQYHEDAEARYLGSWCNPFWLLAYWTDPNEVPTWPVDGSGVSWAEYWGRVREQWFGDVFLPPVERTRQRNHLILSPLQDEQGHTPFLDFAFNGLRWVGVSRWKTLDAAIPSSITLSTSRPGVWTPRVQTGTPDCTVTLGAGGIELSAFAVAEAWVDLDLAQWTQDPWLLLLLAARVLVGWGGNVDSVHVDLVGSDGAVTALTDAEGWHDLFPAGRQQSKYAGSWAIDNGAGVTSDLGTDSDASGMSSTVMGDPAGVLAFQLARGQNYASLRFRVNPTNPALPVTLDWPQFELATGEPRHVWESGKTAALLFTNGPGVRWGQNTWYLPGSGFQDPPVPTGLGTASTIIDALATAKRLFTGTGGASLETTIVSELGDYVDSYEGPASLAVVDKFSLGVLLPVDNLTDPGPGPSGVTATIRLALINSFAETPPLSCFPTRKRSAPTWTPTGSDDYWAGVYDQAQRSRYLVSGGQPVRLQNPDGDDVGEPVASLPQPWYGWRYAPALDNAETNWAVMAGQLQLALLRPWHGFYALVGQRERQSPAVLATWEPRFVRATVHDGDIIVEHAQFSTPPYMIETVVTNTGDCSNPCLAEDPRHSSHLILAYDRPDGAYERRSADCALTWDNEAMSFVDGRQIKCRTGDQEIARAAFLYDSGTSGPGTIHGTYQGEGDDAPSDEFVWKDDGGADIPVADTGFDLDFLADDQMRWLASLTVDGETSPSDWFSTDGTRTWTRITS